MWKLAAAAGCLGLIGLARSQYERKALSVETVEISSDKIQRERTLVFLSDLHDNEFGPDNVRLKKAIDHIHPDGVLSGGDILVSKGRADLWTALSLFSYLTARYPVYCGNGNHESRLAWKRGTYGDLYEWYRRALMSMGAVCLEDSSAMLGPDIRITGLDLDARFYKKIFFGKKARMGETYVERKVGRAAKGDVFQILLAHSPLYFSEYARWGADLTLAGHYHGGTIRIPRLGGVMTPQYQFFLPECAGTFRRGEKIMVVSRGLGTHSINIRINNKPQLVVLKLRPQKAAGAAGIGGADGSHNV